MVYIVRRAAQLFRDSAIPITPLTLVVNSANFCLYFGVFVRLVCFKLLAVIVVSAARNYGNINEQHQFVFMPQLPDHLCFFSCRTLSATKAFNFLGMHSPPEVAALRQLSPLLRPFSSSAVVLLIFTHVVRSEVLLLLLQGRSVPIWLQYDGCLHQIDVLLHDSSTFFTIVSTTMILNSAVYLLFGTPFGIIMPPFIRLGFWVYLYYTTLSNKRGAFHSEGGIFVVFKRIYCTFSIFQSFSSPF